MASLDLRGSEIIDSYLTDLICRHICTWPTRVGHCIGTVSVQFEVVVALIRRRDLLNSSTWPPRQPFMHHKQPSSSPSSGIPNPHKLTFHMVKTLHPASRSIRRSVSSNHHHHHHDHHPTTFHYPLILSFPIRYKLCRNPHTLLISGSALVGLGLLSASSLGNR